MVAGQGLRHVALPLATVPFDLHTHSTASDGTTAPGDVVRAAAAAGLEGIALTDHDTGSGLAEATEAGRLVGIDVLPGVEVSTTTAGRSVHLLGYGAVAVHPLLAAVLAGTVDSRQHRLRRIVERLAVDLPGLEHGRVLARVPAGTTPGRPHVADELVAIGAVPDRDAAFAHYLAEDGPYYVGYSAPSTETAVGLVVAAGGVAVLAHPGSRAGADVLDDAAVERLVAAGLGGLEVDHRDHDERTRERLRALASRHGLLATGSSDFHGAGKENRLGENTTPAEVVAEIRARSAAR